MTTRTADQPKRHKISRASIVDAAAEMLDSAEDLESLTMRKIAERLGVGTMTLYSYFPSKEDLLDGVADQVMGSIDMPAAPDASPGDAIRVVARGLYSLMTEHSSVSLLLSSRVTRARHSLGGVMEASLQRLIDAGVPGPVAVSCYGFLIQYAMGFAAYQAPRPWGAQSGPEGLELRRQQQHFYAALPATEFPLVVAHSAELVLLPTDEQFHWAVETLVQAIEARLN